MRWPFVLVLAMAAMAGLIALAVACAATDQQAAERVTGAGSGGYRPDQAGVTPTDTPTPTAFDDGPGQPSLSASPSRTGPQDQPQAPASGVRIVEMYSELAEDFQTLAELTSAAPVIVLGRVTESRDAPYQNIPFTVLTVDVEKTFKGAVSVEDRLQVVETGGFFAGRSKIKPGQFGEPVEAAFEGVPVMKVGERWLLFVGGYDPGPVATNAYSVLGVFQGKFKVGSDGRIVFTGPPEKIENEDPTFALAASMNGRTLAEVTAKVKAALSER